MKLPSEIVFVDEKLEQAFNELKEGKTEDKDLYKWLNNAFKDIKENAFCGTQIAKKRIPKAFIQKYKVDNLWKYDLPKAWRLLYSIGRKEIIVISIMIEWMDHKNYDKLFKYKS